MGARIMVVDDDPAIRKLLELRFGLEDDFDVFSTGEPEEAVRLAASERPDAMVLDVMMPGMNGFEVCRRVRTADHGDHPVVVMLSARDERESMDTGLAAGADDYLMKPPDLDDLVDRVTEHLRQRSSQGR